ncbi:PEP-CTERM sorting domain-containing protein [Rubellicoccus peritrichatus]|uniref:PEP-CTERM sorting domain-containing protein n=1 Tax=Rubellicoccus peritrichatus TaxID=3080537 RepID=A0AAQ3QWV6_9BACT|nr:PEP-CTERM sorting domain-containing protein [Puniceicoccus sp. CR14]WOO42302.1 PEP-CTERM sorting domain-containing protein [Puniceicoccus sp. CR14]
MKILSLSILIVGLIPSVLLGGVTVAPTSVSTDMGETTPVANLINPSDLSPPYVSGVTDFDTYVASAPTTSNVWLSGAGVLTGNVDFDMGSSMELSSIAIWNADGFAAVVNFNLIGSNDSGFSSPVSLLSGATAVDPGPAAYDFSPATVQYVRMEILSNNSSTLFTGMHDVVFEGTAVPEPGTYALIAASLAGAVVIVRRRMK